MYPERIAGDQANGASQKLSAHRVPSGDNNTHNSGGPLIDKVQSNPEFTRWWRRWVSRVQRMNVRRNAPVRRGKLERHEEDNQSRDARGAMAALGDCEFKRYL